MILQKTFYRHESGPLVYFATNEGKDGLLTICSEALHDLGFNLDRLQAEKIEIFLSTKQKTGESWKVCFLSLDGIGFVMWRSNTGARKYVGFLIESFLKKKLGELLSANQETRVWIKIKDTKTE